MKVLYIINNLSKGGAESLLVDFLREVRQNQQFEFELLLLENTGHSSNFEVLAANHIKVHYLSETGMYNFFSIMKKMVHFIKKSDFSCVHAHLFPSLYYLAFLKLLGFIKIPIIVTEHTTKTNRMNKLVFRMLDKVVYGQFERIICVSSSVMLKLSDYLKSIKSLLVISNGVTSWNEIVKTPIRNELKILPNKKLVLMTARFQPGKDQLTVIKALGLLSDKDICLLFAGEGPLRTKAELLIEELGLEGQVFFLGVRKDVRSIMSQVDLNILSTEFEGLSGVTLENMYAAKPFLGTRVPGVEELVGDENSLFTYMDFIELSKRMKEFLTNEQAMRINVELNLKKVAGFGMNSMVNEHYKVYEEVCGIRQN
ncbi:glycosyltransferase [Sediminibacterium sp. C3]|uniref:glycosyltransferase n=1 Tax=Sediminibacterium sp. C3 TaxID=1267211 RepID=UPI0003FF6567|nr:glycosyltransferase [Sediminibacterium sp. C3]